MRKKSITLLVCVYAALCISYTVVSGAMVPDSDDIIQTVSQDSTSTKSRSSSSDNSSGTAKEKSSDAETKSSKAVDSNTASEDNNTETEIIETTDSSEYESENNSDDVESYIEEDISSDYKEEQDTDSGMADEIPEQVIDSYYSEEDSQEQINDEDEYQEDKPSLSDYLSGLRCSGCRHNCSLLSPRCMNGARKASQAESAYYATYGA